MSYKDIPGWMKFQGLYDEAVCNAPMAGARFLEIGTAFGRSAAYLGERIIESGKSITLDCIDPWVWPGEFCAADAEHAACLKKYGGDPKKAFYSCMMDNARAVVTAHWFGAFQLTSQQLAERYPSVTWDMVFLDGDHSYEGVSLDIKLFRDRIKPGGILAGDDYSQDVFPGVVRAVREAFNGDVEIREYDGWRHWVHYERRGL